MTRGGKRPGAGRKAGTPNRVTAARQRAVEESGLTPLDYLLSVMRDETVPREERVDAANKAAPYVHPKLSAIQHTGEDGGPIQHEHKVSDDAERFTRAIAGLAARGEETEGA